ncbi:hypothetical protein EYF80_043346 [Liparis tanakae]|uniref:Uncharacterized protein n=1 Tax=Liparis tanakae TaxID=230148 RepID=A0A4Z2FZV8_9TELE|nr:hypothetical protein EYF80_043346 [Liparis tanakae]
MPPAASAFIGSAYVMESVSVCRGPRAPASALALERRAHYGALAASSRSPRLLHHRNMSGMQLFISRMSLPRHASGLWALGSGLWALGSGLLAGSRRSAQPLHHQLSKYLLIRTLEAITPEDHWGQRPPPAEALSLYLTSLEHHTEPSEQKEPTDTTFPQPLTARGVTSGSSGA